MPLLHRCREQGAHLNAFLRVYAEEAKQQATAIDQKCQTSHSPELAGMILGLKDLLCYKDHPIQAASKTLEGFVSQFSATAVQRLVDKHAIIIGHQNCDQFGPWAPQMKTLLLGQCIIS
jgi:aspartyl-tRNA(Asn)/glutamyl-tRNA(Gln) amidotransferase subunit A